jgi:two-component system response regulator HupR/HoxA
VIAATNRDLEADVRSGRFREDLYYRLAGMKLHLPPLRDRPADIALIAMELLEQGRKQTGKPGAQFTPDALRCLENHAWPGNVRELQNEVMRMLALAEGDWLSADLLSPSVCDVGIENDGELQLAADDGSLRERMERIEAEVIRETLIRLRGNKSRAAEELGLSRVGLRSKLARYGLEQPE